MKILVIKVRNGQKVITKVFFGELAEKYYDRTIAHNDRVIKEGFKKEALKEILLYADIDEAYNVTAIVEPNTYF